MEWTLPGNKTISLDDIVKAIERLKELEQRVEELEIDINRYKRLGF